MSRRLFLTAVFSKTALASTIKEGRKITEWILDVYIAM